MTARLGYLFCWASAAMAAMAVLLHWESAGFISATTWRLASEGLLAVDGATTFQRFVTAQPAVPYLLQLPLSELPVVPHHAAFLLSAVLAGAAVASVVACLRWAGAGWGITFLATVATAVHPFFAYTVAAGAPDLLLFMAMLALASGSYALRTLGRVRDLMSVGLALAILPFLHPLGMVLVIAILPFLLFLTAPHLVRRGAVDPLLILLFPVCLSVGGYAFVCWVFGSDGALLPGPANSNVVVPLDTPDGNGAILGKGGSAGPLVDTLVVALASLPFALLAPFLIFGEAGKRQVALVWAALLLLGPTLALLVGVGVPTAALLPFLAMALATFAHVRGSRSATAAASALLVGGVVAGWAATPLWSVPGADRWLAAVSGTNHADPLEPTLRVGRFLSGLNGVLVDTIAQPEVAGARGSAAELITPAHDDFHLAILSERLSSPFVAVPVPRHDVRFNRINHSFEFLYGRGAPGYELVYDEGGWRVYARAGQSAVIGRRRLVQFCDSDPPLATRQCASAPLVASIKQSLP